MKLSVVIQGYLLDAATRYSPASMSPLRSNLSTLLNRLGDVEISTITQEKINAYFVWLRTEYVPRRKSDETGPLSGSALDNHWKANRVFWRWCSETFEIADIGKKIVRSRFVLPAVHPFVAEDIKKMLSAAKFSNPINKEGMKSFRMKLPRGDRDTAIILFLLDTGLRVGELCRLKNGDIALETGEVHVRPFRDSSKSRPRTVFIGNNTKRAVWKYIAARQSRNKPDDSLFELTESGVRHTLEHIGEKARVPDVHPHRFRHTFAINFLRNDGDVFTLQRLLGHADLEMCRHYLDLARSDDENAHRRASPVDNWRL